jgi:hypothetical protein
MDAVQLLQVKAPTLTNIPLEQQDGLMSDLT